MQPGALLDELFDVLFPVPDFTADFDEWQAIAACAAPDGESTWLDAENAARFLRRNSR